MSGNNGDKLPGDDKGLVDELEEWDHNFDTLHEAESRELSEAQAVVGADDAAVDDGEQDPAHDELPSPPSRAELDSIFADVDEELDLTGDAFAFATPLGGGPSASEPQNDAGDAGGALASADADVVDSRDAQSPEAQSLDEEHHPPLINTDDSNELSGSHDAHYTFDVDVPAPVEVLSTQGEDGVRDSEVERELPTSEVVFPVEPDRVAPDNEDSDVLTSAPVIDVEDSQIDEVEVIATPTPQHSDANPDLDPGASAADIVNAPLWDIDDEAAAAAAAEFFGEQQDDSALTADGDFYEDMVIAEPAAPVAVVAKESSRRTLAHVIRRPTTGGAEDGPASADWMLEVPTREAAHPARDFFEGLDSDDAADAEAGDVDQNQAGRAGDNERVVEWQRDVPTQQVGAEHVLALGTAPPAVEPPAKDAKSATMLFPAVDAEVPGEPPPPAPSRVNVEVITTLPSTQAGDEDDARLEEWEQNERTEQAVPAFALGQLPEGQATAEAAPKADSYLEYSFRFVDNTSRRPETEGPVRDLGDEDRATLADELELYVKELACIDEPISRGRLACQAGRLSEILGDCARALEYYEEALESHPRLAVAARGTTRISKQRGDWQGALAALTNQIDHARDAEADALAVHHGDIALALGEAPELGPQMSEGDDHATDVRGLLAGAELAFVRGDKDLFHERLGILSEIVEHAPLKKAFERARQDGTSLQPLVSELIDGSIAVDARETGSEAFWAALEWRRGLAFPERIAEPLELEWLGQRCGDDRIALEIVARASRRAGLHRLADDAWHKIADMADKPAEARAALLHNREGWRDGSSVIRAVEVDARDVALLREGVARDSELATPERWESAANRAGDPVAWWESARLMAPGEADFGEIRNLSDSPLVFLDAADSADGDPYRMWEALQGYLASATVVDSEASVARLLLASLMRPNEDDASVDRSSQALVRVLQALQEVPDAQWLARLGLLAAEGDEADSLVHIDAASSLLQLHAAQHSRGRTADSLSEWSGCDVSDCDDPRVFAAYVGLAAQANDWSSIANALLVRATATVGFEAVSLRYRAAGVLLDRLDKPQEAAEVLADVASEEESIRGLLVQARRRAGLPVKLTEQRNTGAETGSREAIPVADRFVELLREAERYEDEPGEASRVLDMLSQALELRPADPFAWESVRRAAMARGDIARVAELALQDLRRAEDTRDPRDRARAYEELAWVDDILRGDNSSATLSWESALGADPERRTALRALELSYSAEGRWREVGNIYRKQLEQLQDGDDYAAVALEYTWLQAKLGSSWEVLHEGLQDIRARGGALRPVLFWLESELRRSGASEELAALEQEIASYYEHDTRANASFLTRAGDTYAALDQIEEAVARYRDANEVANGHWAALRGWHRCAIQGQLWIDLSEAAQREAELARSDAERAALNHLAGVTLMDKALNGERAVWAFRKTLAVDGEHRDAFVRLRILLEEQGEHEDLAQLLEQRLETEVEPARSQELLHALAHLHRNFLDGRDAAKDFLRKALALFPDDLRAVAELSDIAWEQGEWAEAAQSLIDRARLETREDVLKNIFFRLGLIYADRIPDPRWAIKSFRRVLSYDPDDRGALERLSELCLAQQDWTNALGACERLVKNVADPDAKVVYLHRAAHAYGVGLHDKVRQERVYRLALEIAPANEEALSKLVAFYREAGDKKGLRVQLDRVIVAMRERLQVVPGDGEALRVLARVFSLREQAGVAGSLAAARCAGELAQLHGVATHAETRLAAHAAQVKPPVNELARTSVDDILFSSERFSIELRQLFSLLRDRVLKHYHVDARDYGLDKSARLDKEHPVFRILREVSKEMGCRDLQVYVAAAQPKGLLTLPDQDLTIVIGTELLASMTPASCRFVAGRSAKLHVSGLAIAELLGRDRFNAVLLAMVRHFRPDFAVDGISDADVEGEVSRVRKLLSGGGLENEVRPLVESLASQLYDYLGYVENISHAANRAGLVASGSLASALAVVAQLIGGDGDNVRSVLAHSQLQSLVAFSLSEDFVALRVAG